MFYVCWFVGVCVRARVCVYVQVGGVLCKYSDPVFVFLFTVCLCAPVSVCLSICVYVSLRLCLSICVLSFRTGITLYQVSSTGARMAHTPVL